MSNPEEDVPPAQVTGLLLAWSNGDASALEQLIPLVHTELRRIARRHMAHERAGHPLQATALANEAYLRLVDARQIKWQNRAHVAQKRGAGAQNVSPDEAMIV